MARNFLIALSLANISFIRIWKELLEGDKALYYSKGPLNGQLIALFANVLLLALGFWLAVFRAKRSGRQTAIRFAQWVFLMVLFLNIGLTRWAAALHRRLGWLGLMLWAVALALTIFALSRWNRKLVGIAAVLLLIASPFVLVTFAQGVWLWVRMNRASFADQLAAPALPARNKAPRVLWIVFDEFDQRAAFDQRPASVKMPELDRLRAQTLYATHAYPPGRMTELAMPALITGKLIYKAEPSGTSDLLITYSKGQKPVRWSQEANVFSAARAAGFNTALSGWYQPYCRVIAGSLNSCSWQDGSILFGALRRQAGVVEGMAQQLKEVLTTTLGLDFLVPRFPQLQNPAARRDEINDVVAILEQGKKAAADPAFDLVLVHLPVPHPFGIYDRERDDFSVGAGSSFLDNLELTDRMLGELRAAMEAAHLWEETAVLVSGDHWWRAEFWSRKRYWTAEEDAVFSGHVDHRVPFLLKMPGQKTQLSSDTGFNTVLTHDLVLAILRREVKDAQTAAAWLDQHRTIADSPYNVKR
ncbi:MAG TPA: sulfatase-like hydrolase/transferase [Terriglobales bacterium]|nr:sulfatase-like hydrolase/transferase [Terriglobales bacterium]